MPPDHNIGLCLDFEQEIHPISIPPYRVALAVLRKLKAQLQEILRKGFIHPSASLWVAPMLFVKKKDSSLHMCIDYQ